MNLKIKALIIELISALFILLFVYAALSKLSDFEKFKIQLGKSPMLNSFASSIAWAIPIIELLLSFLFVVRRFQFAALAASFTLMAIFSTYIIFILKFSSYIPCSCGGILQNMTWSQHLMFNIAFIILAALAILLYPDDIKSLLRNRRESRKPEE